MNFGQIPAAYVTRSTGSGQVFGANPTFRQGLHVGQQLFRPLSGLIAYVRYVRTTRVWYSAEGKILTKTEETAIEGREEMVRETTTYEYDPKDLRIEAPVK